jgi:hypothetical protein
MKKFLIQFGIFIGIALILAIPIDTIISNGLRKTDIRKYSTWNDIYTGNLHSDVIIIGSSRAWSGYNTYILDSVLNCDSYNLGIDGHCIDFQVIRYNTYKRYNSTPKLVLINTDFLSTLGIPADSSYEREQFFPYIHDDILISQVAEAKRLTWIDRKFPLVRYFGYREDFENGISSFFGKTDFFDGRMHKGYRGNNNAWNRGTILTKDTLASASIDNKTAAILDSFSQQLRNERIQIVFVKSPVYYPLIEKFTNIDMTDSVFNTIAQKHAIPILNYYDSDISRDSTNFYNPSHLNKKGSELFTFQLCHDLDSLGMLR